MQLTVVPSTGPSSAQVTECEPVINAPTEDARPRDVLTWVADTYAGSLAAGRVVTTTGFGMEGCVLLDLIHRAGLSLPVIWIDTGFLFPETHDLRRRLERRYPGLHFVRHAAPLTPDEQEEILGPDLWARDPDTCCRLRKVIPMRRAMKGVDVWITALRRGQSPERAALPLVGQDPLHDVIKVNPLLTWERREVWQYIREQDVPYNPLHEREYPTIGCTHCTRPVPGSSPADYSREGRWSGTGKTECGLHLGSGI